jgi:phage replication-related protein YjqB (UPF0714/DUF867 family)
LNAHEVRYLVVGGYAVGFHGYPRATADLDIWVARSEANAARLVEALRAFGFDLPTLRPDLFLVEDRIVRMGRAPLRIEVMTSISGVTFEDAYCARVEATVGDVEVAFIGLDALKKNKRASGRHKDLDDLAHLSA